MVMPDETSNGNGAGRSQFADGGGARAVDANSAYVEWRIAREREAEAEIQFVEAERAYREAREIRAAKWEKFASRSAGERLRRR